MGQQGFIEWVLAKKVHSDEFATRNQADFAEVKTGASICRDLNMRTAGDRRAADAAVFLTEVDRTGGPGVKKSQTVCGAADYPATEPEPSRFRTIIGNYAFWQGNPISAPPIRTLMKSESRTATGTTKIPNDAHWVDGNGSGNIIV